MNDDELITALRRQRGTVVLTTPVQQIIGRGRTVRSRRRVFAAAGALAAAAVVAFTVGVALPGSHPAARGPVASHPAGPPSVRLAAWTVTRQADGNVKVSFRELADPAALQRTLRADGVPVSVTFTGRQNPACQPYSLPAGQRSWPFGPRPGPVSLLGLGPGSFTKPNLKKYFTTPPGELPALVIDPSALPSGAGLEIFTPGNQGLQVMLVHASPQCTGSSGS
jgi:hypothetical protein